MDSMGAQRLNDEVTRIADALDRITETLAIGVRSNRGEPRPDDLARLNTILSDVKRPE